MNRVEKDYYYNCILNNPRILCRDIVTMEEKLSDLINAYNITAKNVDWLVEMVKIQQKRINELEARVFVKEHSDA